MRGACLPAGPSGACLLPEDFRLGDHRHAHLREPEPPDHFGAAEGDSPPPLQGIPERRSRGYGKGVPAEQLLHPVALGGRKGGHNDSVPPLPPLLRLCHEGEEKALGGGGDRAPPDVLVPLHVDPSPDGVPALEGGHLDGVEADGRDFVEPPQEFAGGDEQLFGGRKALLPAGQKVVLPGLREKTARPGEAGHRVRGGEHGPLGEIIEQRHRAAVQAGEDRLDPVVSDPLAERFPELRAGPGPRQREVFRPSDHLGTREDDQLPPFRPGPLALRVEPAQGFDPVPVESDPGGQRVRRAVDLENPSPDGEIPRVRRGGEPRIPRLGEKAGELPDVDLHPRANLPDRPQEHVPGERLLLRRLHGADDHDRIPGREPVKSTHPLVDRRRVGGHRLIGGHFHGREQGA